MNLKGDWTLTADLFTDITDIDKPEIIKGLKEWTYPGGIHYAATIQLCFINEKHGYYNEDDVFFPFSYFVEGDSIKINSYKRNEVTTYAFELSKRDYWYDLILIKPSGLGKSQIFRYSKSSITATNISCNSLDSIYCKYINHNIEEKIQTILTSKQIETSISLLKDAFLLDDKLYVRTGLLNDYFWGDFDSFHQYYVWGATRKGECNLYKVVFSNCINREITLLNKVDIMK